MNVEQAETARLPEATAAEAAQAEQASAPTLRELRGTVSDLVALLAPQTPPPLENCCPCRRDTR